MNQLSLFNCDQYKTYNKQDYILLEQNKVAYDLIINCSTWNCFILYGVTGSGKTHLAHIWQKNTDAFFIKNLDDYLQVVFEYDNFIIEDIDKIKNENKLLHCYNYLKENNKRLLMTSSIAPKLLKFKLKDLNSRILSTMNASLACPDEELLKITLIKLFSDRQLHVDLKIINYILKHSERSFQNIYRIVKDIYNQSQYNHINIHLVRSILEKDKNL